MEKVNYLLKQELKGVLDIETDIFSSIDGFEAGYINEDDNVVVGLQADAPLKRIINPYGGYRMVENSLHAYNYKADELTEKHFNEFRKHTIKVFLMCIHKHKKYETLRSFNRFAGCLRRGRIIGDFRRLALYGVDRIIEQKQHYFKELDNQEI